MRVEYWVVLPGQPAAGPFRSRKDADLVAEHERKELEGETDEYGWPLAPAVYVQEWTRS